MCAEVQDLDEAAQRAREECQAPPAYSILFDAARDAAGWRTLRGRGGRRQKIKGVLRDVGQVKPRGRPAAALAGWRVVTLTLSLHLMIEHWWEYPPTRPGGPRGEAHVRDNCPDWLRKVWRQARRALVANDRERFLARKGVAVELAVADLLKISRRTVRRRLDSFAAAYQDGRKSG